MGLSQTNLGRLLGLCMRTIIRCEHGYSQIPLAVQMALDNLASIGLPNEKKQASTRWSNRTLGTLRLPQYRASRTGSNAGQRQKVLSIQLDFLIAPSERNDRSPKCSRMLHHGSASGVVSRWLRKKRPNNGFSRSRIKPGDYIGCWTAGQR